MLRCKHSGRLFRVSSNGCLCVSYYCKWLTPKTQYDSCAIERRFLLFRNMFGHVGDDVSRVSSWSQSPGDGVTLRVGLGTELRDKRRLCLTTPIIAMCTILDGLLIPEMNESRTSNNSKSIHPNQSRTVSLETCDPHLSNDGVPSIM